MHFDQSRSHPQLGAWRATYAVDPAVLRQLRWCQPLLVLTVPRLVAGHLLQQLDRLLKGRDGLAIRSDFVQ